MVNGGVEFPQLSYTPLHLATWTINKAAIKTVSELLQFDVDVNVKDKVSLHTLSLILHCPHKYLVSKQLGYMCKSNWYRPLVITTYEIRGIHVTIGVESKSVKHKHTPAM